MRLVYVAGPYRASTEWEVEVNIRRAEAVALEIWKSGAACICPHKNTERFGGAADDETWLAGDREIVKRCDALVCVSGWQGSVGARREVEVARAYGLSVYETLEAYLTDLET